MLEHSLPMELAADIMTSPIMSTLRYCKVVVLLCLFFGSFVNAASWSGHHFFVPTQTGSGLWGLVDDEGKVLIPPIYKMLSGFETGYQYPVSVQSVDGKWGYIAVNGELVLKPTLQQARAFTEEGIARYQKDDKWGFIRHDGSFLTPPIYDDASYFSYGFAAVRSGKTWIYIDTKGKQAFKQTFSFAGSFSATGIAVAAQGSARKYGFINQQGEWVIKPKFDDVRNFSARGHIAVRAGKSWGIVNSAGEWIVKPKYYDLGVFDDSGIAEFNIEYGRGGLMTDTGKQLVDLGAEHYYSINHSEACGVAFYQYDSAVIFHSLADGKPVPKLNEAKYKFASSLDDQCRTLALFSGTDSWTRLEANGTRHDFPAEVLEPYFVEEDDSTAMAYTEGKYIPVVLRNRNLAYVDYEGALALRAETIKQTAADILLMRDANGKELWRQSYAPNTLIADKTYPLFLNKGHQEFGYTPATKEQLAQHVERLQAQAPAAFISDEKNLSPGEGDSFGAGVQLAFAHYNYGDHATTYWYSIKYPDFTPEFKHTKTLLESLYGPALTDDELADTTLEENDIYGEDIAVWNLGGKILVLQNDRYEDGDVDFWSVLNLLLLPTPEAIRAAHNLPLIPLDKVKLSATTDATVAAALKIMAGIGDDGGVELHQAALAVLTQAQSGKAITADDYIRAQYALLLSASYEDEAPQLGTKAEYIAVGKNLLQVLETHGLGQDLLTAAGQTRLSIYTYVANDLAWMLRETEPATALRIIEAAVPYFTHQQTWIWDTYVRVLLAAEKQSQAFTVATRVLTENPWYEELLDLCEDKHYLKWLKQNRAQVCNDEELPTGADNVTDEQTIAVHNASGRVAIAWFSDITVFDLATGKALFTADSETYQPFLFRFNHDASLLASTGWDMTSVWDTNKGKRVVQQSVHGGNSERAGVSANGKSYFYEQEQLLGDNVLFIKKIDGGRHQLRVNNTGNGNVSNDDKLLAISIREKDEPLLKIIDLEKVDVIATLRGDEADPYDDDLFFVANNQRLLVRDYSNFNLWNIATQKLEHHWDTDDFGVDEIAVTDDLLLIVDGDDFTKRVWHFSGKPQGNVALPIPQPARGGISSVAISGDQKSYAVTTYNKERNLAYVFVLDMHSDKVMSQYVSGNPFGRAVFASNDQYLVLNGYPVEVLEAASGKRVYAFSRANGQPQ